jgi:hypothetical protein
MSIVSLSKDIADTYAIALIAAQLVTLAAMFFFLCSVQPSSAAISIALRLARVLVCLRHFSHRTARYRADHLLDDGDCRLCSWQHHDAILAYATSTMGPPASRTHRPREVTASVEGAPSSARYTARPRTNPVCILVPVGATCAGDVSTLLDTRWDGEIGDANWT